MGVSINPSIIIGVDVDTFIKRETKEEKYELHDTRTGKPTGKFETERKTVLKCGDKTIDGDKFYSDEIANLLGVEDNPYKSTALGMHTIDYDNEQHILGVKVLRVDGNYGENGEISFEDFLKYKEKVAVYLQEKFDYEGEVKVFLEAGVYA